MPVMYENLEKEIVAVVDKAKMHGLWFYNSNFKSWLTPEEFSIEAKASLITSGQKNRAFIDQYYMSDPKEGIRLRMSTLKKSTNELNQFTEKVMNYYNFVAKEIQR
jgi:hypothetical protein